MMAYAAIMSIVIHLIRHAQSTFNLHYAKTGVDPMHRDAPLTDYGHAQAAEASAVARSLAVQAVYTTPFTRALQTTHGLFGTSVPIHVQPLHREHLSASCDIGRSPVELAGEFPHLRFDHLDDPWWHDGPADVSGIPIEPRDIFKARVAAFRSWIKELPHDRVAIVGHGMFLHELTGRPFANCEIVAWNPS
jgi:broad specificity phosphatase PhoE